MAHDYTAVLKNMPEPYRSQLLYGEMGDNGAAFRKGYADGMKAMAAISVKLSDNFTKPETDDDKFILEEYGQDVLEKDLVNRAFEKRGLKGGYGMDSDVDEAKEILQCYDDLNPDGKRIAKEFINAGTDLVMFVILSGNNRSAIQVQYQMGKLNVRYSPKGKWVGSGLDGLIEILNWIDDTKATYFDDRWPSNSDELD